MPKQQYNRPIGLIKTAQVKKFIEMLQMIEADIYLIIEKVGLPDKVLNTHHPYIPEIPVRLLLSEIVEACGLVSYQKICWLACRQLFIPAMLEKISEAKNLQQLLEEFIEIIKNESTQVELSIEKNVDKTWLVRRKKWSDEPWYLYAELFSTAYLIELIRALTDKNWLPEELAIQSSDVGAFTQLILCDNPNIRLIKVYRDRGGCAISIPQDLFNAPFKHHYGWIKPTREKDAPTDFVGSLIVALPPYLNEGKLAITKAASIIGMSVRTFQRRLDELGTNYTSVLEEVQLQEAKYYLQHSDITITTIGVQLGYSDLSHFSRAFKRLSGETPSHYRLTNQCKERTSKIKLMS
ncbi:hypothetical protein GCM10007916_08260 [Psychromonas marina]|uniref:HTH araC/xylS-type domain-containing protein n=1 Tax=Psychromonas marina TaxID=88364 RepID=A0ABQ6DXB5_9GAMM|nr:helix-turn-helix transcriptional regulator [Psychromonas marina]GLS89759.1 hypothetical protein GCM10007916_08260 [Psychromonas marina]